MKFQDKLVGTCSRETEVEFGGKQTIFDNAGDISWGGFLGIVWTTRKHWCRLLIIMCCVVPLSQE